MITFVSVYTRVNLTCYQRLIQKNLIFQFSAMGNFPKLIRQFLDEKANIFMRKNSSKLSGTQPKSFILQKQSKAWNTLLLWRCWKKSVDKRLKKSTGNYNIFSIRLKFVSIERRKFTVEFSRKPLKICWFLVFKRFYRNSKPFRSTMLLKNSSQKR